MQPSLQEQLRTISNTGATKILLSGQMLGLSCVDELISSPSLSQVSLLHIGGNYIGDQGVISLVSSPYLSELDELILLQNNLSVKAARALASSPYLCRLTKLNLCNNYLGDEGLAALMKASLRPTLLERVFFWLRSSRVEVSGDEVHDPYRRSWSKPEALAARARPLGELRWLDLGWNKISDEGLFSLAQSEFLSRLSYLNVQNNLLRYEGLSALATSPHLREDTIINASGNLLSRKDKRLLRRTFGERLRL